jgi:hypothetical protein
MGSKNSILCEPRTERSKNSSQRVSDRSSGILSSTHKPKERVDRIILLFAQIIETAWRKMNIASVTANALGGLADIILPWSVIDAQ